MSVIVVPQHHDEESLPLSLPHHPFTSLAAVSPLNNRGKSSVFHCTSSSMSIRPNTNFVKQDMPPPGGFPEVSYSTLLTGDPRYTASYLMHYYHFRF